MSATYQSTIALPPEVRFMIYSHLDASYDKRTLARLVLCSKAIYLEAIVYFYRRLTFRVSHRKPLEHTVELPTVPQDIFEGRNAKVDWYQSLDMVAIGRNLLESTPQERLLYLLRKVRYIALHSRSGVKDICVIVFHYQRSNHGTISDPTPFKPVFSALLVLRLSVDVQNYFKSYEKPRPDDMRRNWREQQLRCLLIASLTPVKLQSKSSAWTPSKRKYKSLPTRINTQEGVAQICNASPSVQTIEFLDLFGDERLPDLEYNGSKSTLSLHFDKEECVKRAGVLHDLELLRQIRLQLVVDVLRSSCLEEALKERSELKTNIEVISDKSFEDLPEDWLDSLSSDQAVRGKLKGLVTFRTTS